MTEALRRFLAAAISDERNIANAAGHGFGHLPLRTLEKEPTQPNWTRLDYSDNVRPTYDLRFAQRFSPDAIDEDYERKLAIVEIADEAVLLIMANEFAHRPGFDPAWARTPRNNRQFADALDALR